MIDLNTRLEGIQGVCPQYVWMFVGPRPDPNQPPTFNDNDHQQQFILDSCASSSPDMARHSSDSSQASKESAGAAALSKPGIVVTYPPNAQAAGQDQQDTAAAGAAAAPTPRTTTIKVDVYDVTQLQGFQQPASGIRCTWSQDEGNLVPAASVGGVSAAYACDSCGQITINKSCSSTDPGCALASFECVFGAKDFSCSGSSCGYGHK
jgi:hypothetical protein